MGAQKGFKNNSGIFNEEIMYYHRQVTMVGDNELSQGKTLQGPNPKLVLPLSFIKYDLNHVSDLETEIFRKNFCFLKDSEETIEVRIFRADEEIYHFITERKNIQIKK